MSVGDVTLFLYPRLIELSSVFISNDDQKTLFLPPLLPLSLSVFI